MNNIVRDVSIQSICRKDAPALGTLCGTYFLAGIPNRSPSKLSVQSPFIRCAFINKHKLVCLPVTQTPNPVIPYFLIAFCSQFVALFVSIIRVTRISELRGYTTFRLQLMRLRTLDNPDSEMTTSYSSQINHAISSRYALGLSFKYRFKS